MMLCCQCTAQFSAAQMDGCMGIVTDRYIDSYLVIYTLFSWSPYRLSIGAQVITTTQLSVKTLLTTIYGVRIGCMVRLWLGLYISKGDV